MFQTPVAWVEAKLKAANAQHHSTNASSQRPANSTLFILTPSIKQPFDPLLIWKYWLMQLWLPFQIHYAVAAEYFYILIVRCWHQIFLNLPDHVNRAAGVNGVYVGGKLIHVWTPDDDLGQQDSVCEIHPI